MMGTTTASLTCPYCWEAFDIVVDPSLEEQQYVEDCYVCCRPIVVALSVEDGQVTAVDARRENE